MVTTDWLKVRRSLEGQMTSAEERLLDLLTQGKTQPEVAAILGMHRSAVWRRLRKLKQRVPPAAPDEPVTE